MKKSIRISVFVIVFLFAFQIVCYAWLPDSYFRCEINPENIPENTEYIDLLLPIQKNDENYTSYNSSNGEKFGIVKGSEIVKYNDKGYVSYTFHYKNTVCNIKPYYEVDFFCEKEFYDNNIDLFKNFEKYNLHNSFKPQYLISVHIDSDLEKDLNLLLKTAGYDIKSTKGNAIAEFHTQEELDSNNDNFDWIRKKYKFAKMAYLDKSGKIISISNEVKITSLREITRGLPQLKLSLIGNNLSSSFSFGPPIHFLFIGIHILIIIAIISIVILIVNKARK